MVENSAEKRQKRLDSMQKDLTQALKVPTLFEEIAKAKDSVGRLLEVLKHLNIALTSNDAVSFGFGCESALESIDSSFDTFEEKGKKNDS